jgi:hypothetical protein
MVDTNARMGERTPSREGVYSSSFDGARVVDGATVGSGARMVRSRRAV